LAARDLVGAKELGRDAKPRREQAGAVAKGGRDGICNRPGCRRAAVRRLGGGEYAHLQQPLPEKQRVGRESPRRDGS
jgi:hypothetical protein